MVRRVNSRHSPLAKKNTRISLPPAFHGVPQINVTFTTDANVILNASAEEKSTGNKNQINITKSRLVTEEIKRRAKEVKEQKVIDNTIASRIQARSDLEQCLMFKSLKNVVNPIFGNLTGYDNIFGSVNMFENRISEGVDVSSVSSVNDNMSTSDGEEFVIRIPRDGYSSSEESCHVEESSSRETGQINMDSNSRDEPTINIENEERNIDDYIEKFHSNNEGVDKEQYK